MVNAFFFFFSSLLSIEPKIDNCTICHLCCDELNEMAFEIVIREALSSGKFKYLDTLLINTYHHDGVIERFDSIKLDSSTIYLRWVSEAYLFKNALNIDYINVASPYLEIDYTFLGGGTERVSVRLRCRNGKWQLDNCNKVISHH